MGSAASVKPQPSEPAPAEPEGFARQVSPSHLVPGDSKQKSGRYHVAPRKIEDDFEIDSKARLGAGMNGFVYLAKAKGSESDIPYAVKPFRLVGISEEKKEELVREVNIFLTLDHPHVARLLAVYETDATLHLVMECMQGGELYEHIQKKRQYSEADAAHSAWQMLLAVQYIHGRGVVHRDLKLENFLYETKENDHLKLIDFGLSTIWEPDTDMAARVGTLAYMSPELLAGSYTKACDLWSLGVICFVLTLGYMPFSGSGGQLMANIRQGDVVKRPARWAKLSDACKDFIERLLASDPGLRLTSEDALKHDWIAKRDQSGRYRITPLAQLQVDDDKLSGSMLNIDDATIQALSHFSKASRFRRACMSVMAWTLSQQDRAAVRDAFIELDVKRQGTIKLSELKLVLSKFNISEHDCEMLTRAEMLEAWASKESSFGSSDAEIEIHYSEFLAAMMLTRIQLNEEHMVATFKRFDTDDGGFITHDNLREVLGEEFSEAELKDLTKAVDPDNNDKMSYESFVRYLQHASPNDTRNAAALELVTEQASTSEQQPDGIRRLISRSKFKYQNADPATRSRSCALL